MRLERGGGNNRQTMRCVSNTLTMRLPGFPLLHLLVMGFGTVFYENDL
jgi:hypothetical protein